MYLASFARRGPRGTSTKDLSHTLEDDLLAAYGEVERRLIAIANTRTNHRGRCTARWLGKWAARIDAELQTRGGAG
jgi:hypothetical protein